jgi:hypothetical protein
MNAVVTLRVDLNIPEKKVNALVGEDNGSADYRERALDAVQRWVEEEPAEALHFMGGSQPEAEVDG